MNDNIDGQPREGRPHSQPPAGVKQQSFPSLIRHHPPSFQDANQSSRPPTSGLRNLLTTPLPPTGSPVVDLDPFSSRQTCAVRRNLRSQVPQDTAFRFGPDSEGRFRQTRQARQSVHHPLGKDNASCPPVFVCCFCLCLCLVTLWRATLPRPSPSSSLGSLPSTKCRVPWGFS